jgi:hypothetical protein
MCPETHEHLRIKELVLESLRKKYGLGLKEYPDSGNIADVFAITSDGIEIFVENVWTASKNNFYRDLHTLRNSRAFVKIFIVNPEIIKDKRLEREYEKVRFLETKRGIALSKLIDGSKILNDFNYVNQEFIQTVDKLVGTQRSKRTSPEGINKLLKHSKRILLTRSDYQGLDQWHQETLMKNLLIYGTRSLETNSILKHFETGYPDKLWKPLMEYKGIMEKYGYLKRPYLDLNEKKMEFIKEKPNSIEEKQLLEAKEQFLHNLNEVIFALQNGIPLKGWCDVCKAFHSKEVNTT